MPLTVGACTYSWLWDLPLHDAVHRIADLGFRYFELGYGSAAALILLFVSLALALIYLRLMHVDLE